MTTSNTVRQPLLLAAFEGWSDAACAASDAAKYLLNTYDSCIIGRIDSDEFFNLQASRPLLCTAGGRKRISWPETAFYSVDFSSPRNSDDGPAPMWHCPLDHRLPRNGDAVIVALGPEPDRRWRAYCGTFLRLAGDWHVGSLVCLASLFSHCPHTRNLPLAVESGKPGTDDSSHAGPVGIATILTLAAQQAGIDSSAFWISVPTYLGDNECPRASCDLLQRVAEDFGFSFNLNQLEAQAVRWRSDAQTLLRNNESLADYVRTLEQRYDSEDCPHIDPRQAKRLVEETEKYLRLFEKKYRFSEKLSDKGTASDRPDAGDAVD
ncbi:MAG: PAC2 family protein [Bifidobacteriaceae bacterium]|nr:PAC2 family protein [Aeriscardovia sp.]MEE1324784.1 PAC2 family protein [Bifidobacteriaceae bacterium]